MRNRKMAQKADGKITGKIVGKVSALFGMTVLLGMLSGCGNSGKAEDASAWEIVHTDTEDEKLSNAEWTNENESGGAADKELPNEKTPGAQSLETIYGNVKSISGDSLVISRAFEMESDEDDAKILVGSAKDYSTDETLITISVSGNTKIEIHTVKNGGVNGDADVEKSEGTMADIKEEVSVDITGSWEGAGFCAEKIIVYHFV